MKLCDIVEKDAIIPELASTKRDEVIIELVDALARGKPDRGSGDTSQMALLAECESPSGPESQLIQLEFRREVFRWAARQIRSEFQRSTWDAFWMTAVEGQSVEEVAEALSKNCGAIYAARSRVMRRIQEKSDEFDGSQ